MSYQKCALITALSVGIITSPAWGQSQCSPREIVVTQLGAKFKEAPIGVGINSAGRLIEILSSGTPGTWTILATDAQGVSCIVTFGENWQQVDKSIMEPEA